MAQAEQTRYSDDTVELISISTGESVASDEVETAAPARDACELWLDGAMCRETDAPAEACCYSEAGDSYLNGLYAEPRPVLPGYDTGIAALVIGAFLLVALNMRHYTPFLKGFAQDLWSVRLRDNLFEDHTVSETKVIASLVIMLCVSGGVLLDFLFPVHCISDVTPFLSVLALAVCVAVYYAFQLCAYSVVGYVFTSRVSARIWLRGFNASQVLLSLCVWVPALIVLFNPALGSSMLIVGGVLYVLARIIFISKGFRIFYNNIPSLIYFILYLCALEIIPLVIAAHVAHFLTQT